MILSIEVKENHIILWLQKDVNHITRQMALKELIKFQEEHKNELLETSDAVSLLKELRR